MTSSQSRAREVPAGTGAGEPSQFSTTARSRSPASDGRHGLLGLAVGERDPQIRVGGPEAGEGGRGEGVHRGRDRADPQLADHLVAQPVEVEPGGGDAGEDVRGVLGEHPARGREAQAPPRRLGEHRARLAVELRQLLRHRGRREVQGGRRPGHRPVRREGVEGPEPVEGEHGSDSNEFGAGNLAGSQRSSGRRSRA